MFIPRTVSTAIDRVASTVLGKDWALYAALLEHWPEIVGPEYARVTTPVKIAFPPRQKDAQRSGGTLTVKLPKGLAMEFTFRIGLMRERISGYFGYEAISKIVFEPCYELARPAVPPIEPDPIAVSAITETAKDIADEDLRTALEAFGISVLCAPKNRF